jgi:hypothetical protein
MLSWPEAHGNRDLYLVDYVKLYIDTIQPIVCACYSNDIPIITQHFPWIARPDFRMFFIPQKQCSAFMRHIFSSHRLRSWIPGAHSSTARRPVGSCLSGRTSSGGAMRMTRRGATGTITTLWMIAWYSIVSCYMASIFFSWIVNRSHDSLLPLRPLHKSGRYHPPDPTSFQESIHKHTHPGSCLLCQVVT